MEQKITLTIVSASGDLTDEFPTNQKIGALKTLVMARLKIDPSAAKEFRLVFENQPLDEGKTLQELEIPDGATLILEPEPEVI